MAQQNRIYHRARRKGYETSNHNEVIQRREASELAETHIPSSVEESTRVPYDRTTMSGNSFGILGNVYHSHVHVHHHYHGSLSFQGTEPWGQHITEQSLSTMTDVTQNQAETAVSETSALLPPAMIGGSGPSAGIMATSQDITMSYSSIRRWLSSTDLDGTETQSVLSSTAIDNCPSLVTQSAISPSVCDDSSEYSFATCVENLNQPTTPVATPGRKRTWSEANSSEWWPEALDYARLRWEMTTMHHPSRHEFHQWISCTSERVIWIKGRPGSGKSTLISLLCQHFSWHEHGYANTSDSHIFPFWNQRPSKQIPGPLDPTPESLLVVGKTKAVDEEPPEKSYLNLAPGQSLRAVSRLDLATACGVDANVRFRKSPARE